MDFVGYAALGGLERVTIVAGAIIIGYWGYRLYAGEKKAGLVFMGLAVAVLIGALATGSGHLKTVGEGLQLASAPPVASTPAPEPASAPADSTPSAPEESASATAGTQEPAPALEAPPPAAAESQADASAPAEDIETAGAPESDAQVATAASVRLATGQELGGRIVSVKSENVTLEWSPESR